MSRCWPVTHKPLTCLRVAVSAPVKGTFSYTVPEELAPLARVGHRALVPFNNRKVTGFILEEIPPTAGRQDLKEILEVEDVEPLFNQELVPFFEWIADYYVQPLGLVIQSALPARHFKTASLTQKGLDVLESRLFHSEETRVLSWVKENSGKSLGYPLSKVYPLQEKGWLTVQDHVKKGGAGGTITLKLVRPREGADSKVALPELGDTSKAENELEFLETVLGAESVLLDDLKARFKNAAYLVNKWVKRGVIERHDVPVHRNPAGTTIPPPPVPKQLNDHQTKALDYIKAGLDKGAFSPCLLYGVTGSGKTEVYFKAVEHAFLSGRQAIVMVPEISLAVYMEGIFRSRLGNRVAVYHSRLGQGERQEQWMRMVRGEADLVIGARSALFAPMPRLGLIVVDEEHDSSYTQEDTRNAPHYQARDAAVLRAKMAKAVVVLGSGTPSVQSFENSMRGRYHLLSMPDRVEKRPLPDVEIVDMKSLRERRGKKEMISPRLREAIHENLEAGKQTILFLNRRGFHRLYLCRSCGGAVHCANCNVALTHHMEENLLVCHYCGFCCSTKVKCGSCGRKDLRPYGFGTQKLEHEIKELFPKARISRMDADSTRRKGRTYEILKRFGQGETDILVGTQMITKGYDFQGITLVGVISADLSLGFPDFRSGERTFQILSQVSGRAGRGIHKGRVIIQTFNPDHYAVRTATEHNYQAFFEEEETLRRQLGYPPFSHLACLRLQGNNQQKTEEAVRSLGMEIRDILHRWPNRAKEIQVLGPAEAPISRLKGKYRWQILIKSKGVGLLKHLLREVEAISRRSLRSSGVHLIMDVDPYQMF